MKARIIGGILLIVGTSIGAGMLALPVANAATGFWQSSFFLLFCWAIMTFGALFILEANLYLPKGKHMLSMASETLGKSGILIAWISYLFLLYTLLSAYISGGADVFNSLGSKFGFSLKDWQASTLFTFVFGAIVYGGIYYVDLVNRGLMFGKLAIYLLLVIVIAPFINSINLHAGDYRNISTTIMILITSFGYAIIIPNLRDYFDSDVKTLRKVILIGSLIPLLCYLAWNAVIIGSLGDNGGAKLAALMQDPHTTSSLSNQLALRVNNQFISSFFNLFTSICMLTAFLGVSLCLISFFADGLKKEQKGKEGIMLFLLTFLPPLLVVIYYPGAYIHALNYAGFFCVILLLALPALMVLWGRKKFAASYKVPGGNVTPILVLIISFLLILNMLWQTI